jgi:hypothetical protein
MVAAQVTDGKICIGEIVERADRFEAITTAGKSLGLYNSASAAISAVWCERDRQREGEHA